ncbi:hypothetical protein ACWC5I_03280 [Kitasatospora sp. NPDC001574]
MVQRTKTWNESTDPYHDAKLDRVEDVLERFPARPVMFDEFGPLGIRPTYGHGWCEENRPARLPAAHRRTHGVTNIHGCCPIGDDTVWGVT